MDSIEKMRRINDLTRELKQRGFAESSFEAIQQANQIYGQEDVQEHVRNGIISSSQNDRMGSNMAETESMTLSVNTDRKLNKLSENMDTLTNKMNEIIKAINDIDSRISDLKNKHEHLSSKHESLALKHEASRQESSPRPESRSEVRSESSVSSQANEKPQAKAEPASEANQRTGGFQSQDVSIDKMFYFGNKKS